METRAELAKRRRFILSMMRLSIMERYILRQFLSILLLCLFAAVSLFLVIEAFEKMRVFTREQTSFFQAITYLAFNIPLIIQLMTPVAVLIATLITIGRLSQLSEITAMRACGASILLLSRPLLLAGMLISILMFITGETLVPWATKRVEEIYEIDIRKKHIKGNFSKEHFWYREDNNFYSIGFYDSRNASLESISAFSLDNNFRLRKKLEAKKATWGGSPLIGWTMKDVVQTEILTDGSFRVSKFKQLPFLIKETPEDFFNFQWKPESLSYTDLKAYINKLSSEGVPATRYLVNLASKISFPLVNLVVMLVAIPFALIPARSGNLSASFVAGISIGFGYYIVHAISTSIGAAELVPVLAAAWTANILLGGLGAYLMAGAEYS